MKQSVIILVMMLLFSFSANAQMMRMDPKEKAEALKEKLELNDEQTKQVEDIYIKADNEIKATMQEGSRNREQLRAAIDSTMNTTDNEILKTLNYTQKEKYNKIIEDRKKQMERRQTHFN